ncbi:hypothetical protein DPMN_055009 [Dreissena polymorpha]|uniref:RING-type domain-containing protein n=1 Tax=Dreissena polymorpha TaxID=45954 RepID=A0A9D4CQK1_DREPO|nr:hypothetical protein DPMN_055009 [Dreissena polymorpha]
MLTFKNTTGPFSQTPESLAAAGFYFTGRVEYLQSTGFSDDHAHIAVRHLNQTGNINPSIEDLIDCIVLFQEKIFEENASLRTILKCTKCRQNNRNALFLPSCHLMLCMCCARGIRFCPSCNKEITETKETCFSESLPFMMKENARK